MPDRLTRIRTAIAEAELDGLVISSPSEEKLGYASRYYCTGFTGSAGLVVILPETAFLAADFRYVEQAEREAAPRGFQVFPALHGSKVWFPKLVEEAGLAGKKLGLSKADLTYAGFLRLEQLAAELPAGGRPSFVPAPPIIETARRIKDVEEFALLQRAIDISDAACEEAIAAFTPDQTEREVALAFQRSVKARGGEDVSFESIVATGPWSAMPHARPRDERLGEGRPIVMDVGARFAGYCSDLTRTVTIGAPDARFREIYEIVFEAQQNAIERVEAGMTGVEAHNLAQSVIDAAGYGEQFGHGLGHGVGLDVHEDPHVGLTSEDVLEEGMVFTIEPGIYLPGWGGVRIEDVVVLENGKARVMSHARKLTPAGV